MHPLSAPVEWFTHFDFTPDLICIAGKDGYFKKINKSVIGTLGYTEAELFEKPIATFIHPDDQQRTSERRLLLLKGEPLIDFENRYITKSGEVVWLHWTSVYLSDIEIVFAIAKNITAKKKIELDAEVRSRIFETRATHFKSSIEKDRRYFAYELQEEVAQLAAAIKMNLSVVASDISAQSAEERIAHTLTASQQMLNTIQRLSFSLSPKMLDDFGLIATLEWLCKEFTLLNGIPCRFECNCMEWQIPANISTDFFRICQEALMNVIQHASAGNVFVSLTRLTDKLSLTVTDDGIGFSVSESHGHGLAHIKQLAASVNATIDIKSEVGKGTVIQVVADCQG